jgi:hypothetical protein
MTDTLKQSWPRPTEEEIVSYFGTNDVDEIVEILHAWQFQDGGAEATDGCWVEPDGVCPHGHPSWLLKLGVL